MCQNDLVSTEEDAAPPQAEPLLGRRPRMRCRVRARHLPHGVPEMWYRGYHIIILFTSRWANGQYLIYSGIYMPNLDRTKTCTLQGRGSPGALLARFEIFQSLGWVLFYLAAVIIFSTHMCLGWQKVVPAPALEIPKKYHSRAIHMGSWDAFWEIFSSEHNSCFVSGAFRSQSKNVAIRSW